MTTASYSRDVQDKIDRYLNQLRERLQGVGDEEATEIVKELRSHITEKISGDEENAHTRLNATLAALGSPDQLAREYTTDNLLARAETSRSPIWIIKSLFHWATLSIGGLFSLIGASLGYFFGIIFVLVALAKLIHPHTAGLWSFPDANGDPEISFRLGFGAVPEAGRDLLGWWIVPIGLLVGCGLVLLTTRIAVWLVRQYRKSRALRG